MRLGALPLLTRPGASIPIGIRLLEANTIQVGVSNVPAPSTSAPSYGKPSANHERIIIAMERSLNLVKMEKMVLAESKARKQVVGGHLESIKAVKLLPRGWIER